MHCISVKSFILSETELSALGPAAIPRLQLQKPPRLIHEAASEEFERVFVSPPSPLQSVDSSAVDSVKAAQHLPGLWCAPYGSHGLEVLQLFFSDSLPPEDVGGIQGLSVVGLKVLGDPNVPAHKISFVASLEASIPISLRSCHGVCCDA